MNVNQFENRLEEFRNALFEHFKDPDVYRYVIDVIETDIVDLLEQDASLEDAEETLYHIGESLSLTYKRAKELVEGMDPYWESFDEYKDLFGEYPSDIERYACWLIQSALTDAYSKAIAL